MSENKRLTPDELAQLKDYIAKSRRLKAAEPPRIEEVIGQEAYDRVAAYILQGVGDPPPHLERFTITEITGADGKPQKAFYDTAWEAWNADLAKLQEEYHDSIANALKAHLDGDGGIEDIIDQIIAAAIEEAKTFSTIRQGTATKALTKVRSVLGLNTEVDQFTGTATVTEGDLTITFPHFDSIKGLETSTYKLLDALLVSFTESGGKSLTVMLPLDEYMEKCGLKDRKEARKRAKEDLETLFDARISYKEKDHAGQPGGFVDLRICDAKGISKRGIITFSIPAPFAQILKGYPIMPYPAQLWRINQKRNPNSYYFLRRIAEHKNMNIGKKNEDIISVKTLLSASPYLPKRADVAKAGRQLKQRIIDPFERDMDELEETLIWEYCHSNNTPLTDEELQNFSYELFEKLLVKITWKRYPDQTARLERKAARIAAADKKKTTSKRGAKMSK